MTRNPFPGPQPYRSADRAFFFGRDDLARKLESVILATRCLTVHGPSGAGKSSLVQAAVLPTLEETRDVRIVRVDAWPEDEPPAQWLMRSFYSYLRLGVVPTNQSVEEAIMIGAKRTVRASDRLVIVYLDQLEQLFFANRSSDETDALFTILQGLAELPVRSLRLVLSLREDYLGRFRDRLRDRGRLLENTFRVGPLTVGDLTAAVCHAARSGEPPQEWSEETMQALLMQVRIPGQAATAEAEAQAAYAQIVCRALYQERATGQTVENDQVEAEPILRRYFDATLSSLGKLQEAAQRLLEDHLVSGDGSRTLRTEKELLRILPQEALFPVLEALEGAAILHASAHQGSRYFEIGHDWLARKVFEERQKRVAQEEARKKAEEIHRAFAEEQKRIAEQLQREARRRKRLMVLAGATLALSMLMGALVLYAWRAQSAAETARRLAIIAQSEALKKRIEASDQRLLAGYAAMTTMGHPSDALKLLSEVKSPSNTPGWLSVASEAVTENKLIVTLSGHTGPLVAARFSPDGKHILTASTDGTARIWNADGKGLPVVLSGHKDAILFATWSPRSDYVLTTSADGTANLWNTQGRWSPIHLEMGTAPVSAGVFAPDGQHIALGTRTGSVLLVPMNGKKPLTVVSPNTRNSGVRMLAFFPDPAHLLGATNDNTVALWSASGEDKPVTLVRLGTPIDVLVPSEDGTKFVVTAGVNSAKLFTLDGTSTAPPRPLACDRGQATRAALSSDSALVAIACTDGRTRIFSTTEAKPPLILDATNSTITKIQFRPDNKFVAITSRDGIARIYSVDGGQKRFELRGHSGGIGTLSWSHDGKRLVTGASDERSNDYTAKVWNTASLDQIHPESSIEQPRHAVAVRPDGQFAAAAFDDNVVRVRSFDGQGAPVELRGHTGWISRVSWSPDGARILTASFDMTARVWPANGRGDPIVIGGADFNGHTGGLCHAAFSADGTKIITSSEDKTAKVWLANQPSKPLATLAGHKDWVTWATFSPNGKYAATASEDELVRLYALDEPSKFVTFEGHRGTVNTVSFSPDGTRIASASDDGTVRIFAVGKTTLPITLSGNGSSMMQFAVWSSTGKRIAAASSDHLVYLWNTDGPNAPSVLAPPSEVMGLHFMDEDRTLMAILADGSTRVWQINVPELLASLNLAHADCLPVRTRERFLEESHECATYAHELCESVHERGPVPEKNDACEKDSLVAELERLRQSIQVDEQRRAGTLDSIRQWLNPTIPGPPPRGPDEVLTEEPSLEDMGQNGCRARVVVLPVDSDVDVNGRPANRKNGTIELLGHCGDTVQMRVRKGRQFVLSDVKITNTGANPPNVTLPPDDESNVPE